MICESYNIIRKEYEIDPTRVLVSRPIKKVFGKLSNVLKHVGLPASFNGPSDVESAMLNKNACSSSVTTRTFVLLLTS